MWKAAVLRPSILAKVAPWLIIIKSSKSRRIILSKTLSPAVLNQYRQKMTWKMILFPVGRETVKNKTVTKISHFQSPRQAPTIRKS